MIQVRIALIIGVAAVSILAMLIASASLSRGFPKDYDETDIADTFVYQVREGDNAVSPAANAAEGRELPQDGSESAPASGEQADDSVRAVFVLQDGLLSVQPADGGSAFVASLGAPSCIGQASDLRWHGMYEARWTPATGETSSIFAFPEDFEIVQPTEDTVTMQPIRLGDADLLAYAPRYADCHALETYFFGVRDGRAFPVSIRMADGQTLSSIGQQPGHETIVNAGELVITGGFAAGMETVPVYAFRYEPKTQTLGLTRTEQRKLTELGG